jgi:hypothetical protein
LFAVSQTPSVEAREQGQTSVFSPHEQVLTYEVYAGGINAVRAELNIEYKDDNQYRVFMTARTQKLLGKLVPWNGSFESYGWQMKDGSHKPKIHESISVWEDEKEIKTYSYNKDGTFGGLKIVEEGVDKSPEVLEDELVDQTVDALTAALYVMEDVGSGQNCEGSSEVFDGKRRFKMNFNHEEEVTLSSTKYNIYEGDATICTVEVEPVAGKWHKKPRGWISIQEQGRDKGTMPTVWMAKVVDGSPAVPVKMRIKTDYGTLFMHLVRYENGDTVLAGKK